MKKFKSQPVQVAIAVTALHATVEIHPHLVGWWVSMSSPANNRYRQQRREDNIEDHLSKCLLKRPLSIAENVML